MIVVDVETTGLIPGKHAIVAIGAVEFEKPQNQFYLECRIDAKTEVSPKALEVNGFTLEQINDPSKPTLTALITEFTKWLLPIKDKTLAGFNTGFDVGMLMAAYRQAKLRPTFPYQHIDLHTLMYTQLLKSGELKSAYTQTAINSDFVAQYVGLPKEPRPHHGLTGAKYEAEAFSRLIYARPLLDELKKYLLPDIII